jgi:hypothetical protein
MIRELKSDIYEELSKYMYKTMYSHAEEKSSRMQVRNSLINDVEDMLKAWKKSKESYSELKHDMKGF